jgi:type I restriction enzyme S subunit
MEGMYRAYPEYKDSEVEWLGDIPAYWNFNNLKYQANVC